MTNPQTTNDFPKLGIKTDELRAEVETLIASAGQEKENMGAVNWGDIGVADIEYRLSMLSTDHDPRCVVIVEEADPSCHLVSWLNERLSQTRFPNTHIECEW